MRNLMLRLAVICCIVACAGDFVVTFILGAMYPGYDLIRDSESYLGTSGSPVAHLMNLWSVFFFLFLLLFAVGLGLTKLRQGFWEGVLVWLIAAYGAGEGLGSGLFPYDHVNGALTTSGTLHSISGAIGGTAVVFIPLVCLKIFPRKNYPGFGAYCMFTFFNGLFFIILFLLAHRGIIPYKGLLQRIFIFNYHVFIMMMALLISRNLPERARSPGT
ncbi:DUF998 domain-containing protein [Fulvivirgaceae bacterium PWU4]|uniref:DUF998 domain-containing protein n=1 Tax=Chryseosolibacter histidini TaxID=2782349 RepID=A0AAP2DL49_9BACT|nr:DUF998 domain-containing protein [Chryseosolibacter histidini]MBT1697303.1 DUF998 domain-containing protein [Chryseosolibacter histidini]